MTSPRMPLRKNNGATIAVELTALDLRVLTAAMSGNFPDDFDDARLPLLRKLAKADFTLRDLPRAREADTRALRDCCCSVGVTSWECPEHGA